MLYRTHHHTFLFTFNPFSHSSSLSLPIPPSSSTSSSSLSSCFQGMDCVQGALKGGFGLDAPARAGSIGDEFWGVNGGVVGDDFFVDQLLDFSNDFAEAEGQQLPPEEPEEKEKTCSVSQEKLTPSENGLVSAKYDFGPLSCGELAVPAESGLESLEWLSHFVEDSFSDYSLTVKLPHAPAEYLSKPAVNVPEQRCFTASVQTKARTKRARSGVRVLPVLSPSVTESSTSSSSSTYSTASLSPTNPLQFQCQTVESLLGKSLAALKQRKKPSISAGALAALPRRCSHCGVTKTPQWRAGPLGSKTLCNACGVRYKSGRLLPEYRPACSPTFSTEIHSNNHRKVLEMRRKKESEMETAGLDSPVQSF